MEHGGQFLYPESAEAHALPYSTETSAGGFLLSGKAAWCLDAGSFIVYRVPSGEPIGHLRTGQLTVSHVCELQRTKQDPLLVLACREAKRSAIVALFSPGSSQLLRAIRVPYDITSMCVLSARGLDAPGLFSNSVLSQFMGVVAVGCKGGLVFLLDLALGREWAPVWLSSPCSVEVASVHSDSLTTHMVQAEEEQTNFVVKLTGRIVLACKNPSCHVYFTLLTCCCRYFHQKWEI